MSSSLRCLRYRSLAQSFPSTSNARLKLYALGGLSASALSIWLWNDSEARHQALRPLSPSYFTPTTLTSSEKANENAKLLRLSLPAQVVSGMSELQPIWSIYVKDSDIQVERPYTPLEGISASGEMAFWIKRYSHGEVGRWLHSKSSGEKIEIRGPERTWTWRNGDWDSVIMIAGGTGVAPFFQLLQSHLARKSTGDGPTTKFTLLQSYRSPNELPPACILDRLASWSKDNPQQLEIQTFVDTLDGAKNSSGLTVGRISKSAIKSALKASTGRTIVLVCGPEPMINALAGPKGRDHSQGPVSGILGEFHDRPFNVWKL